MRIVRTGAVGDIETEEEMRARFARWSQLAREGQQVPDMAPAEIAAELAERRKYQDVVIIEFLDLDDGRRITADCGLGFSARVGRFGVPPREDSPPLPHPWAVTSLDELREEIQGVVEADADEMLEGAEIDEDRSGHAAAVAAGLESEWLGVRWTRLVLAAAAERIAVTPQELALAPFEVELTDRLLARRESHLA
jgi:hypothetical protein